MADKKITPAKIAIKESVKGKSWKNISGNDKDSLLKELCIKAGLFKE